MCGLSLRNTKPCAFLRVLAQCIISHLLPLQMDLSQGKKAVIVPHQASNKTKSPSPKANTGRTADWKMREDMLSEDALFLNLERCDGKAMPFKAEWDKIWKKGIKVTKTGCMIPYPAYWPHSGASGLNSGPRCAAANFKLEEVTLGQSGMYDELGWPCEMQLSHLCHHCMKPLPGIGLVGHCNRPAAASLMLTMAVTMILKTKRFTPLTLSESTVLGRLDC